MATALIDQISKGIVETIHESLLVLDSDLKVILANRSFFDSFEVTPEETLGSFIYDLGNRQWDILQLRELLENIIPEKASFDNYSVENDFPSLGRRTMLLNARQIEQGAGEERIILLAIEDITDRMKLETMLRDSEIRYRHLFETADDGILLLEKKELKIRHVNPAITAMLGYSDEECVGKDMMDIGFPSNTVKVQEILESLDKEGIIHYKDIAVQKRTGQVIDTDIYMVDKANLVQCNVRDVAERKEIEAGLDKAHEELKELTTRLKLADLAKSEFLANMSHELRTPLNSIIGFSEALYDETFGPLNEKQSHYVSNVLSSGKHLLLLINQILDMTKVEAGKMTLTLSSLHMKSLLNEILLLVGDMVAKKKMEILLEIGEDLPNIEADDLKVKEILYNLLSNAVKFTPEGGKIGVRVKKADSEIEIVIWDTGVGIASENMQKIFEAFFRVDTPYSRITEGTGLGLPLSQKLVELHGGNLSVESEGLNKGTLVRFTLPITSRRVA